MALKMHSTRYIEWTSLPGHVTNELAKNYDVGDRVLFRVHRDGIGDDKLGKAIAWIFSTLEAQGMRVKEVRIFCDF